MACLDNGAAVCHAIQQRGCHLGLAKASDPFLELRVGGDDDAGLFGEIADRMEEQCTTGFREPDLPLANILEANLCDTAVTWMALGDANLPKIVSVTGHTMESATQILRHYLPRHPEMADSAIGKMVACYAAGGETELGL